MNDGPTDYQLALRQLEGGGFTELAERGLCVLIAAVRVHPDTNCRPLKKLEGRSLMPDMSVRTRLVFDADGVLVSDECIINRKAGSQGRKPTTRLSNRSSRPQASAS